MVEGNSIIKMEDITKVNGRIIRWMDTVSYIMKGVNWRMKEVGTKINLMDKEKYTMIIQCTYLYLLIIQTLMNWRIIGNIMKELSQEIQRRAEEE